MDEIEMLEVFSNNLKKLMKENDIDQKKLACNIGVTQSTISRYLNGQRLPSVYMLLRLSEELCCSMDDFFEY